MRSPGNRTASEPLYGYRHWWEAEATYPDSGVRESAGLSGVARSSSSLRIASIVWFARRNDNTSQITPSVSATASTGQSSDAEMVVLGEPMALPSVSTARMR
ncbi:hypothetical protein FHR84_003102 [Actinopolyspora biskrensis]|uniref:Uncharacterized protein n=1 Tax=Actinopolyspora biskrensis TaxID=1470178 RepID=A0A852YXD1_9ACTN|nr:hypothetical protein [Actinopolyspora biskrensis]